MEPRLRLNTTLCRKILMETGDLHPVLLAPYALSLLGPVALSASMASECSLGESLHCNLHGRRDLRPLRSGSGARFENTGNVAFEPGHGRGIDASVA